MVGESGWPSCPISNSPLAAESVESAFAESMPAGLLSSGDVLLELIADDCEVFKRSAERVVPVNTSGAATIKPSEIRNLRDTGKDMVAKNSKMFEGIAPAAP
jgi:hypothetical protein